MILYPSKLSKIPDCQVDIIRLPLANCKWSADLIIFNKDRLGKYVA